MDYNAQIEQLRKDRVDLHLTIRECAELTNTSESTAKRVFSSNTVQNFNMSTLQPYIDLFSEMREQKTDIDTPEDESVASLMKLYRAKCRDYTLLRLDAEKRDRRHSIINMVQTIIIFILVLFMVAWLVYNVIKLDRGWIRTMFSHTTSYILDGFSSIF